MLEHGRFNRGPIGRCTLPSEIYQRQQRSTGGYCNAINFEAKGLMCIHFQAYNSQSLQTIVFLAAATI